LSDQGFVPQHSRAAEAAVLGSMLRDNGVILDVLTVIHHRDLYLSAHQQIWSAIIDLYDRNCKVDAVTVAQKLRDRGHLEDVGGYAYIGELLDAAPTAANAIHYARIVKEKSQERDLYHVANEILRDSIKPAESADDAIATAQKKLFALSENGGPGEPTPLSAATSKVFAKYDSKPEGGIPSGFVDLDRLIGGIKKGELTVVAARPSHGKTAWAVNLALNAMRLGIGTFFVSLEQSEEELAQRFLCCEARVSFSKVSHRMASKQEIEDLIQTNSRLTERELLHISDKPGQNMLHIAAAARRQKLKHGVQLVIVDYVQFVDPIDRRMPLREQVSDTSKRLKVLAREHDLAVVALAQLNRGPEDRNDHRPRLSDLKESGNMEQDADLAMLLVRPELYDAEVRPGECDVIVAKQRNGPTGVATLIYQGAFMRFFDAPPPGMAS